jgi:hypothetical protein
MTENDTAPRDRKQTTIIVLAVVLTVVVGLIIGFLVSGGLSGTPAAAPTTTTGVVAPQQPTTVPQSTVPPTTTIPGLLSVIASEDTHVDSSQPTEINGLDDVIELENDPPEVINGLIRFEVPAVPEGETVESVTLRLFVLADTDDSIGIHTVNGDWTQAETTWENAPEVGEQVASIPPGVSEGGTVEVDMTSMVQGPGRYDFYLIPPGDDSAEFAATESGANAPVLDLDYGSGAATAAAAAGAGALIGSPVLLMGAGDISDCANDGDSITAEMLDEAVAEDPEAIVFTTGDNVYGEGTPEQFAQCYEPTWGRHKDRTRPSAGNHEYATTDAEGYFAYFGEAAGEPGQGYYSYEAGAWQVLVLNSNCDEIGGCDAGSPQETWLRQELESSEAACTVAYWHSPLFSSGQHGNDPTVQALFTALYDDGAEVVINGHDHNYERFAPQDPQGTHDPVAGVRQFVVGTGGRGNREFGDLVPNSEARFIDTFGILKMSLYDNGYEWEFVPEDGSGFTDVGVEACH